MSPADERAPSQKHVEVMARHLRYAAGEVPSGDLARAADMLDALAAVNEKLRAAARALREALCNPPLSDPPGVLYENKGRWYIGMHGDSDVTDYVGMLLAETTWLAEPPEAR